jgi:hypothetical protein
MAFGQCAGHGPGSSFLNREVVRILEFSQACLPAGAERGMHCAAIGRVNVAAE